MNLPIVSLDKIYIKPDEENIFFLDCTRVSGSNMIISRKKETLNMQIIRITNSLNSKEIILADDVVFSGNVLKSIINRLSLRGITVVGIITSICTAQAYEYFNQNLKYGLKTNYIMSDAVIDQICERDFYFGVAGSGIIVNSKEGLCKAPYFKPYGDPCERASVPKEYEEYFSQGCLERSLYLWENIDRIKGSPTKISELPEKIVNTTNEEEVVKTLRREIRR